jgi:hypothetical protein
LLGKQGDGHGRFRGGDASSARPRRPQDQVPGAGACIRARSDAVG